MKLKRQSIAAVLALSSSFLGLAKAEIFTYTDGNLILGIQATSGAGSTKNVFFDLGPAISFRDNGNQGSLGNIGTTLAAEYGADWYEREDLWFGVIANLNQNANSGPGSRPAVDGDPSRTFYVSTPANVAGGGVLYAAGTYPNISLGGAGNSLAGLEKVLTPSDDGTGWNLSSPDPLANGLQLESDGAGVLDQTLSQHAVAWENGWTHWNPTPGAAFSIFTGGIQQNFGKGGTATHVDLQRVLSTNTGATPQGVVGGGTYVTTISISPTGQITASVASSGSSPFEDWVATFPDLVNSPNEADRTPEGDFDKDGVPNIREFAFGGSPVSASDNGQQQLRTVDANGDSQGDLTLTVEVRSGATFTPSGNKLTATQDGVIYTIEGSLDLVTFESAVSEVTPTLGTGSPKSGYVFKTFRLNASAGLNGKGFIRAGAAVAP